MRAAGVRRFGGPVEVLEVPGPRGLRPDEVLIEVRAGRPCGPQIGLGPGQMP